jgi:hypothetical protein
MTRAATTRARPDRPRAALLAAALTVAGACAAPPPEPRWMKPGATQVDLERDRRECGEQASRTAAETTDRSERGEVERGGGAFLRCMNARGWTQVVDPDELRDAAPAQREAR